MTQMTKIIHSVMSVFDRRSSYLYLPIFSETCVDGASSESQIALAGLEEN